jgi:hypothetical protein
MSLMVIVASIYLTFYIEVGVGTFLMTQIQTPPKFLLTPWLQLRLHTCAGNGFLQSTDMHHI